MHHGNLDLWLHSHDFGRGRSGAESRTRVVIVIAGCMMVTEIAAGSILNSMALFADGWHMATHVTAFFITALAYYFAHRHLSDPRFSFGTGKMEVLGGFVSAIILGMIGLFMGIESALRVFSPQPIHFDEAIAIATIGLAVNLSCALVLNQGQGGPGHAHAHQGDLNLRSAYVHVLADAFTSVTAILALVCGKFLHWAFLDPVMGLVGTGVVISWAIQLIRNTGGILLDQTPRWTDLVDEIHRGIEADGDSRISDLHVWQIGSGTFAAIVAVVADAPKSAEIYKEILKVHEELVHVTIEVHRCQSAHKPELVRA